MSLPHNNEPPLVPYEWCQEDRIFVDSEILVQIAETDSDLTEFYAEMTEVLVDAMGWDIETASRYILDWAAQEFFGYIEDATENSAR